MDSLRSELVRLLEGKGAHADFEQAIKDLKPELRGVKRTAEGTELPHSAWELLEHLRLAQKDMLEFSRDPGYSSPKWPEGYWPSEPAPADAAAWDRSVEAFRSDLAEFQAMVSNPQSDLNIPFAHGSGQTLLREALQLADHNAYHVGELVFLRRVLNDW